MSLKLTDLFYINKPTMDRLEEVFGMKQVDQPLSDVRGILQTKDDHHFQVLSDTGNVLHEFTGAKFANKCLPGDHIAWVKDHCELELRDQHPPMVGTLELTNKSSYGMTKRGNLMYLFTPYDKKYPHFIVGSGSKDRSKNLIALITFDKWEDTFPRGNIHQILGVSGEEQAEREALIWQACPWRYPKFEYMPEPTKTLSRTPLTGYTFHIDPEGCRDVDDVFTFEQVEEGWKIIITISDVAAFVEDGSAVDIMASLIGQTLYDLDGRVMRPMLPKEYSEQMCSLLPGKGCCGVSLQFVWTGAEIKSKKWFLSMFRVNESYSYEQFQSSSSPYKTVLEEVTTYLAKESITDAHDWVAQMMIFYNTEAGAMLKRAKMGILRRHSEPKWEQLEKYKTHVPELEKLAFSSAEYCLAEEEKTQHYGLTTDTYAHASSPIRRYADLVNQRVLHQLILGLNESFIVPQAMYDMNQKAKANKNYARDLTYLNAIITGRTEFQGIIIEKKPKENGWIKIKLYVPVWKRMVSTTYRAVSENVVLSRDETTEIDVTLYRETQIKCAFSPHSRNWKERVVLHLS
jgi:exoribonuclease R